MILHNNIQYIYISFTFMSWLWIYCFPHHSIALVVDSPQFFNRLAESFISRINARFIVLLWGDKSCIDSKVVKDIPLYDYKDMTKLGWESRNALLLSGHQGNFLWFHNWKSPDCAVSLRIVVLDFSQHVLRSFGYF